MALLSFPILCFERRTKVTETHDAFNGARFDLSQNIED